MYGSGNHLDVSGSGLGSGPGSGSGEWAEGNPVHFMSGCVCASVCV